MRSFLLLAAAAHAQNREPLDDSAEERYFFTNIATVPTVPTVVTTSAATSDGSCWKCDEMSYTDCAANGRYTECGLGESNSCFYEIRETNGKLSQLCTGCKETKACKNLQAENFRDSVNNANVDSLNDQCRPSYHNQRGNMRNGAQSSVCRQCSDTCRDDKFGSAFCFGSVNSNVGKLFTVPFSTVPSLYPGLENPVDTQVLGIPTYAFIDASRDPTAVAEVTAYTYPNLYFKNTSNGKVHPNVGDNIRTLDEMVYWSLQGASRSWWASDLAALRKKYNERLALNGCTAANADLPTFQLSGCTSEFAGFAP